METAYQQETLRSANGVQLIIALYDGALRFLYRAVQCTEEHDEIGRRIAVKRVVDILMYLQARLRTDIGGRPAASLAEFYAAMFTMTLEASHLASAEQFTEVMFCLRNVREAWVIVAQDPEAQQILPRELRSQHERYTSRGPAAIRPSAVPSEPATSRWSA
jgi:flagellar secretion chaperone FliS